MEVEESLKIQIGNLLLKVVKFLNGRIPKAFWIVIADIIIFVCLIGII